MVDGRLTVFGPDVIELHFCYIANEHLILVEFLTVERAIIGTSAHIPLQLHVVVSLDTSTLVKKVIEVDESDLVFAPPRHWGDLPR